MAHSITFQMVESKAEKFSDDEPDTSFKFNESTVKTIIVVGDPWVVFDTSNYGGDFVILIAGKHPFPSEINDGIIRSMRKIKDGINSSQVTFYPLSFYKGTEVKFESKQPELDEEFFSLRVDKGAVIFYEEKHYKGKKKILLKGDTVENYTAVDLTYIGKSMKIAEDVK